MSGRSFLDEERRLQTPPMGGQGGQLHIPDPPFELDLELTLMYNPHGLELEIAHNQGGPADVELPPPDLNTEGANNSVAQVAPVAQPQSPQPLRPAYICPICLGPVVEETTTTCGHIFCGACIKSVFLIKEKCPICRCKITRRGLRRLYFSNPF